MHGEKNIKMLAQHNGPAAVQERGGEQRLQLPALATPYGAHGNIAAVRTMVLNGEQLNGRSQSGTTPCHRSRSARRTTHPRGGGWQPALSFRANIEHAPLKKHVLPHC